MRRIKTTKWFLGAAVLFVVTPLAALAQEAAEPPIERAGYEVSAVEGSARPTPGPLVPSLPFLRAVQAGTRTLEGRPGERYFQPYARYDIEAALEPETGRVEGTVRMVFENRTPARQFGVVLNLYQNLHAEGVIRLEPVEITGGFEIGGVRAGGVELSAGDVATGPSWAVDGTTMSIRLPRPLEPGSEGELAVDFAFAVPQQGAGGRMGHSDREMYYLGYWFPRFAVFDDLRGWDAQPFTSSAEMYDGFGDYRVRLTVPEGWTVMATGRLLNGEEVYTAQTLERLAEAAESDETVAIATREDRDERRVTLDGGDDGLLTYEFEAVNVRDFAWSTSDVQLWNSTSAVVADRDGDGAEDRVAIHSFYREYRAPVWADQTPYGKWSVEFHSEFTDLPYPWPHMTSVEGTDIIGGGMEFPMMTVMGPYTEAGTEALFNVTSHEIAHMWIPMIVASNEKRHSWLDEGFTDFLENQSRKRYFPDSPNPDSTEMALYHQALRFGTEEPILRHGDSYQTGFTAASYKKPAGLQAALRELLGEERFMTAYRRFISDWAYRHPTPWDLFNSYEAVVGSDLDWFWVTWYDETWALDQAVAGVERDGDVWTVRIADRGFAPMPSRVRVTFAGGETIERIVPVQPWLSGATEQSMTFPVSMGVVERVEVIPFGRLLELPRENNIWSAEAGM